MKKYILAIAALAMVFASCVEDKPYTEPIEPPVDYTGLVINEVDGNMKYVELYNTNATGDPLPLYGVSIKKNEGSDWWKCELPAAVIAPGEYYVIATSGATGASSPNCNETVSGGISPKQNLKFELIVPGLTAALDIFDRTNGTTAYGQGVTPDYNANSFTRIPDGTGSFKLSTPTIGTANTNPDSGAIVTNP